MDGLQLTCSLEEVKVETSMRFFLLLCFSFTLTHLCNFRPSQVFLLGSWMVSVLGPGPGFYYKHSLV